MTKPLLLIEDMPSLQMVYQAILKKYGHEVVGVTTAKEGLDAFRSDQPHTVLMDLMLPDGDGLEVMTEMLSDRPQTRVIVITANGSINKAVQAMRLGAFEFLVKPFTEERLINAVENAISTAKNMPASLPIPPKESGEFQGFIGSSTIMEDVYRKIQSISSSMATVFISGESGTGKEVCAQAVHELSLRSRGPFVPLNCGAIPADLLESEVFGHLKGSFTGAIHDKIGAAGAADGGTLFLDEICEMDLNLQTKLLRFLQTSTIQPVGSTKPRKVNVRIICATNRDPYDEVRKGRFREDLFYRLHVVPIHLPPLADRGGDAVEIAEKMIKKFAEEEGKQFQRLEPEVKSLFGNLPWPGNVRQLLNVLRNVVVLNDSESVSVAMLPLEILHLNEEAAFDPPPRLAQNLGDPGNLETLIGRSLSEIERIVIEETLEREGGAVSRAARILEISPSTLYRKLEKWNG